MLFQLQVNTGRLRFDPVTGRRTWYLSLRVFGRTAWFQWWDTARSDLRHKRWVSLDHLMCATSGIRK